MITETARYAFLTECIEWNERMRAQHSTAHIHTRKMALLIIARFAVVVGAAFLRCCFLFSSFHAIVAVADDDDDDELIQARCRALSFSCILFSFHYNIGPYIEFVCICLKSLHIWTKHLPMHMATVTTAATTRSSWYARSFGLNTKLKTFDLFELCSNAQTISEVSARHQSLPLSQARALLSAKTYTHTHATPSKRILWVTHFFPDAVAVAIAASSLSLLLLLVLLCCCCCCCFINCTYAYEFILFASFHSVFFCSRNFLHS